LSLDAGTEPAHRCSLLLYFGKKQHRISSHSNIQSNQGVLIRADERQKTTFNKIGEYYLQIRVFMLPL
jgi:hypothetical protein